MSTLPVPPTLLVIDDDRNLLFGLQAMFRQAHYHVLAANDGTQALRLILNQTPDLIICDVMMPPPNGFELQRILRQDPRTEKVPFIFLSARTAKDDILQGLQSGADDYILKPFDPDLLLAKINNLVLRARRTDLALDELPENVRFEREYDNHMKIIRQIARQIHSDLDVSRALHHTLTQILAYLNAKSVELSWRNEVSEQIEFRLRAETVMVRQGDAHKKHFTFSNQPADADGQTVIEIPIDEDEVKQGFLRVFYAPDANHDPARTTFLETLINYLSIIMDKERITRHIEIITSQKAEYVNQLLGGLTTALDLRDHDTGDHTQRVMEKTLNLARKFGLGDSQLEDVRLGSMVHDIGKIAVPDYILSKPGALSDAEWKVMRMHPYYAIELLSKFDFLDRGLDIPLYHHERWDGRGYPFGLSGHQIPFSAQLFSIVDVWDALTNDRVYHKAIPTHEARKIIQAEVGKAFNPRVVPVFLEMIEAEYSE